MHASQSHAHAYHGGRLCRGRQSVSVVRSRAPLSRHIAAPHCRARQPSHTQPCRVRQSFLSWPTLSKSVATENSMSQQNSPLAGVTLSCAHKACRARLVYSVAHTWPPICRGQLCHDRKILCRNRNSLYLGQLYRNIELLYHDIISPCLGLLCRDLKILYRDLKILCRDRKSSQLDKLCRNIELLCHNTIPLIWPYSVAN